jgi:hypothetical protein
MVEDYCSDNCDDNCSQQERPRLVNSDGESLLDFESDDDESDDDEIPA